MYQTNNNLSTCKKKTRRCTHVSACNIKIKTDTFNLGIAMNCTKDVLSYRESNKGSKERRGLTLDVNFTEVSVL